jgi:hypothetical protein
MRLAELRSQGQRTAETVCCALIGNGAGCPVPGVMDTYNATVKPSSQVARRVVTLPTPCQTTQQFRFFSGRRHFEEDEDCSGGSA